MIDPRGLLEVANELAKLDSTKPRQAALRRAVSTAYYALFHALIQAALIEHIHADPASPVAHQAARWFEHGKMRKVCEEILRWADAKPPPPRPAADAPAEAHKKWEHQRDTQPRLLRSLGGAGERPSPELRRVAECFVSLYGARMQADYDPAFRLARDTARAHVGTARIGFEQLAASAKDPTRKLFLLLLLTSTDLVPGK